MALRVVAPCSPASPAHGAHISFKRAKANFHLSLSGCGSGSLEICTHVILMPESHDYPHFTTKLLPPKKFGPDLPPHTHTLIMTKM